MEMPNAIIEKVKSLQQPVLIGISGFGGSGKKTLAELFSLALNTSVVCVDSFNKDKNSTGYKRWEIMDFARLENEVLLPFVSKTNPIKYGHFDWAANGIVETREVYHNGFLIVEGVGLFRPELLKFFSYKIWVDCPLNVANERGKKRDREVHNNPQDKFWDGIWKENEMQYFDEYKPNEIADAIISNC